VSSFSEIPTTHPEGLLCSRASSNSDKWSRARGPRRNRGAGAPSETPAWPGWGGSSCTIHNNRDLHFGPLQNWILSKIRMLREILLILLLFLCQDFRQTSIGSKKHWTKHIYCPSRFIIFSTYSMWASMFNIIIYSKWWMIMLNIHTHIALSMWIVEHIINLAGPYILNIYMFVAQKLSLIII